MLDPYYTTAEAPQASDDMGGSGGSHGGFYVATLEFHASADQLSLVVFRLDFWTPPMDPSKYFLLSRKYFEESIVLN